jgi:ABC-type sulfate transport system permease component
MADRTSLGTFSKVWGTTTSDGTLRRVKKNRLATLLISIAFASPGALMVWMLACRNVPVENQVDVPFAIPEPATPADAAETIWRAGRKLGWVIAPISDDVLEGTLRVKAHVVVVKIPYDTRHFSIVYERGQGRAPKSDGTVHENYNVWMQRLAEKICAEPQR